MHINKFIASLFALTLFGSNAALPVGAYQTFKYPSEASGEQDSFLFQPPLVAQPGVPGILLVFFHGFGQPNTQPYTMMVPMAGTLSNTIMGEEPGVGIASVNYTGYGSQSSTRDVNKAVHEVLQKYNAHRIVLMGLGSGGTVALNYACVAPDDIKEKIEGVFATEPSGDVLELYNQAADGNVKQALSQGLGKPEKNPQAYKDASFLYNAAKLGPKVKVCIMATTIDGFSKMTAQKNICKQVKRTGNKLLVVTGPPAGLPEKKVLKRAMAFVLHPGTK